MNILHNCPKCGNATTIEYTDYFVTEACEHCLEHWKIHDYEGCCKKPELIHVRFMDEGGKAHVRMQCLTCGDITKSSLPGFTSQMKSVLPAADKGKRDLYSETKWKCYEQFMAVRRELFNRRHEAKDTLWWQKYTAYLQTDKWKQKRLKVLKRDNYICQACLERPAEEVHHTSYDMVGHEPLFQLVSVCKKCHDFFHKLRNPNKAS